MSPSSASSCVICGLDQQRLSQTRLGPICNVCCDLLMKLASSEDRIHVWYTELATTDAIPLTSGLTSGERRAVSAAQSVGEILFSIGISPSTQFDFEHHFALAESLLSLGIRDASIEEIGRAYQASGRSGGERERALDFLLSADLLRSSGPEALRAVLYREGR
jgi:hypothetical protein